jgi:hypothetical protein
MAIDWVDLGFAALSKRAKDGKFFRIDREASAKLVPTWVLVWIHQPSPRRHSKQHWLRHQKGIASKADAMALAEQWQAE